MDISQVDAAAGAGHNGRTATERIQLDPATFDEAALEPAAARLREGGLVAFPTETVYGIAAARDNPDAVRRLLELRGSPDDKLLTLHIADRDAARKHVGRIPVVAQRLMERFWPGPLTIVMNDIGVRFPSDPIARALIRRAGVPVVAPSANRSGQPPATDAAGVPNGVDIVIDGGPTRHRKSSTVVRADDRRAEVLREGAIPASVIDEVNYFQILFVCTGNTCRSAMAEGVLKQRLAGRPDARVLSAGTAAGEGVGAFENALIAARERGIDLEGHRSQPVTVTLVEDSNVVFIMTDSHRELLVEWAPDAEGRVFKLDAEGKDIRDPMFGPLEVYRECIKKIEAGLDHHAARLA